METTTGSRPQSRRARDIVLMLLAVLCVHLIIAFVSRHGIIRDDADSYVLLGRNLAHGHGFVFEPGRPPTAWRAPGYPVFLAGIFALSGGALWPARIVNALMLTLAALLGYRLALQMLPGIFPRMPARERNAIALITAGLIGFYPEFAGLTGLLWSENLFVPLFLGAVSALYAFSKRQTVPYALLAGVLIALCVLTRSTSIILVPVIWFCALRPKAAAAGDASSEAAEPEDPEQTGAPKQGDMSNPSQRPTSHEPRATSHKPQATSAALLNAAIATVATLLLVGCWTARNYALTHRFILVESNIGYNLYVGNRPDTPIPFAWKRAATLEQDPVYQQLEEGRTEAESSAALTKVALREMARNPGHTLLLAVGKVFDFWLPDFFIGFNLRSGALGPENAWLWRAALVVSALTYLVVQFCALAGIIRTHRTWEVRFLLLILVLYTFPHAVVYGLSRYHLPLMPLLFLLAAPVMRRIGQSAIGSRQSAIGSIQSVVSRQ